MVTTTQLTQEAHDGYFSTFTMHTALDVEDGFASHESGGGGDIEHDRTDNHAGYLPMGRKRRQLSDSATVFQYRD